MSRAAGLTIGVALVIAMCGGVSNAAAQTEKYPRTAAIGQYLMEGSAEILLERSAAPVSMSDTQGRRAFEDRIGRGRRPRTNHDHRSPYP